MSCGECLITDKVDHSVELKPDTPLLFWRHDACAVPQAEQNDVRCGSERRTSV